jgi:hypothetical protein
LERRTLAVTAPRFLALVTLFSTAALAQEFILDITDGSNVPLPANRMVPVHVIYTGSDAAVTGFKVLASRFASDQESVPVDILGNCIPGAPAQSQPAAFALQDGLTASFCLRAPELSGDGKYSGSLNLFPSDKKPETPKKFSLSRAVPPPAILATDRSVEVIELTRPVISLFSGFDHSVGSVALQEKSAKGMARGVAVQIDSSLKTPDAFDLVTGLTFAWNGEPWDKPYLTSSSAGRDDRRSIEPGNQVEIAVTARSLQPGEYIIPLRFMAPGATADNAKLSLTVHVRDSVWLAVAVLLAALVVSFVITKMLTGKRRRIALLREINDLRLSRGTTLPNLPPVVWVDAVLHLADRLSSRFWLTGADVIDSHVNSVRSTVAILKQARELRASLQQHLHKLIFDRSADSIDRVVAELGSEPPDDAMAARIATELAGFNNWLQGATFPAAVWTTIQAALQKLQRDIGSSAVPENVKDVIQPLKTALDAALATPPQTADTVEAAYRNYARLRILWDCREEVDVLAKLTASPEPGLEECFRLNDDLAWERLKAGSASLKIQIPSTSDPEGLEAFVPLAFSVTSDDPGISGSYMFHRKVQYAWKFTLDPAVKLRDRLRGKKLTNVTLAPATLGPSVAQYFPGPGKVKVSVALSYNGDTIPVGETPGPDIHDSSEFGLLQAFEGVEYVSWAVAAAVALATGLSTYYFKTPTFGAYQDYVTLALWGVGMDQGKNFLQALQSVSSQPGGAQAAH